MCCDGGGESTGSEEKDLFTMGEAGGDMIDPRRVRISSLTTTYSHTHPPLDVIHPPARRMRS